MKKFTLISGMIFIVISLFAQPPQAFNYQAVVRNSSGEIIANQLVGVRINIRNITVAGTIIYQESHSQSTNAFGLLNLKVGTGTPSIGTFSTIDWRNNAKFIEVLVDVTGGTNFVTMGTSELQSVPYALFSKNSSDSYWTKSGSNLYYNEGNLGLGTSSPNRKLEINGNNAESGMRIAWGSTYPTVYGDILYNISGGLMLNSNAGGGGWADISFQTNGTTKMFIESAGNVGIGTTAPDCRLVVKSIGSSDVFNIISDVDNYLVRLRHTGNNSGALYLYDGSANNTILLYGGGSSYINGGNLGIGTSTPSAGLHLKGSDYPASFMYLESAAGNDAGFRLYEGTTAKWHIFNNSALGGLQIYNTAGQTVFFANQSGNVGIGGTTLASGYKLSVDGKVACEEVLVELSGSWPDYVFNEDYQLTSLEQLESQIKSDKHLPGFPSAREVGEKGFQLGEIQKQLVQKIEELTLYAIEQDKMIKKLSVEINLLKEELKNIVQTERR